jgi:hypothetical protein
MTTKTDTLATRLHAAGFPYEITDTDPGFLLSGGRAVVALYAYGTTSRAFAGFYASGETQAVAAARAIRGVHAVYVVESHPATEEA